MILLGLLAVAFGLRMAVATWWQQRLGDRYAFGMPDTHSYWVLGHRLAEGSSYEYGGPESRIFRAPGYPLLLAGLFKLLGPKASMLSARIAGAVLGTLTVGGIIWLTHSILLVGSDTDRLWSQRERIGWTAGGLAAVYPGAIAMSIFVLSEALFCPLMVLQLIGWVRATGAKTYRGCIVWSIAGGIAGGLAILTRPSWFLFTPLVVALVIVTGRNRRRHVLVGVCLLVAMCATMAPWWVRNYRVVGHFVPTTAQVGASLYDGLNPEATGASEMSFTSDFHRAQKAADAAAGRTPEGFEIRLDHRLRNAAISWAVHHPREVLRLMGRKFARMWNPWPNYEAFQTGWLGTITMLGYVPLLLLSLVGTGIWCWRGWPLMICVLPAIYYTGLHMIFVGSIRYRQPAMLVWLILAAAVIVIFVSGSRTNDQDY
ncbi:MAG: ArnT family glycosyltransferase [Planctomycetota bacterium]